MRFYFNHRRSADLIVALVVICLVFLNPIPTWHVFRLPDASSFQSIMLAIAGSGATLTGFVLAASTFLISHTSNERFAILRTSAGYPQLFQIIRSSMWRLIVLTAVAGIATLTAPDHQREAAAAVCFVLVLSSTGVATLVWCTLSIVSIPVD
jgi:hypothetical protein